MQVPVQVFLKDIAKPDAVRGEILKAADALSRFHQRITACRVSVTNPDTRHRKGGLFDVHVALQVPGHADIVVNRRAEDQPEREHLTVSLRKAFAQARRRLQEAAREMRGEVKTNRARVASAVPAAGEQMKRATRRG